MDVPSRLQSADGRLSSRFAMMLRWIWDVPPYTDAARE
jgi:hypothetical protein